MWAIDPFTSANGATVLFPNSHKWDSERLPTQKDEQVSCCMSPGSVALFLGTTWHGGGRNVSDINRMGVSFQYCEPFLRPQVHFFLSLTNPKQQNFNFFPFDLHLKGYLLSFKLL